VYIHQTESLAYVVDPIWDVSCCQLTNETDLPLWH